MVSDGEQIVVLAKGQIASGSSGGFISLNSADQEQLESLPGVGPSLASAIIEYRSQIGSFADLEQLREVSGIGPKLFAKIITQLTL
jgi:competence protein ComEA